MSRSSECRECGEPLCFDRNEKRFVCPCGCDTSSYAPVDEEVYRFGDRFFREHN